MKNTINKTFWAGIIGIQLLFSIPVIGQIQEEEDTASEGKLSITGYLDTYFSYNFNRPPNGYNQARVADYAANSISLGQIQTLITYEKEKYSIVADLTFGPSSQVFNYGNVLAGSNATIIKQAYISFPLSEKITLTVGQYGTHMGYEAIEPFLNTNYSLSYQFSTGPIYHTGAKFDFQLNESTSMMLGIVNGWDQLIDYNNGKSITAQVRHEISEKGHISLNWIGGDEGDGPANFGFSEGAYTSMFDLSGKYQLADNLTVGTNMGFGNFLSGGDNFGPHNTDGSWWAAAGYLSITMSEKGIASVRLEHLNDPDFLRTDFGSLNALTATYTHQLMEQILIKPEFRMDWSQNPVFNSQNGAIENQTSVGLAIIGTF